MTALLRLAAAAAATFTVCITATVAAAAGPIKPPPTPGYTSTCAVVQSGSEYFFARLSDGGDVTPLAPLPTNWTHLVGGEMVTVRNGTAFWLTPGIGPQTQQASFVLVSFNANASAATSTWGPITPPPQYAGPLLLVNNAYDPVGDQVIGIIHIGSSVLIATIGLDTGVITAVLADVTKVWAGFGGWKGEVSYFDPVARIFYMPIYYPRSGLQQLGGFPVDDPESYTHWPVPNPAWEMVAIDFSAARNAFIAVAIDAGQHNPAELPQLIVEYVAANATWNILYKFPPSTYLWPNSFGILDLAGGGTLAAVQVLQEGEQVISYVDLTTGTLWDPLESTCRHASLSIL